MKRSSDKRRDPNREDLAQASPYSASQLLSEEGRRKMTKEFTESTKNSNHCGYFTPSFKLK